MCSCTNTGCTKSLRRTSLSATRSRHQASERRRLRRVRGKEPTMSIDKWSYLNDLKDLLTWNMHSAKQFTKTYTLFKMIFRILCLSMFLCLETPLLLSEEVQLTCEQECEVKWANHDQHRLECKGQCALSQKMRRKQRGRSWKAGRVPEIMRARAPPRSWISMILLQKQVKTLHAILSPGLWNAKVSDNFRKQSKRRGQNS